MNFLTPRGFMEQSRLFVRLTAHQLVKKHSSFYTSDSLFTASTSRPCTLYSRILMCSKRKGKDFPLEA